MSKSKFYDKIKCAQEEREVEDVYNEGINLYFLKDGGTITHPYKCDGMVDKDLFLRLIIEYKYNEDLHNSVSRAKVLTQVVFYLKQFELNGDRLPNVVMVGDINEVFVMHTNPLLKFLDEKVDWSAAPSGAHEKFPELVRKIANDSEVNPYVYDINETFSFKEVSDKILEIATNTIRKIRITEHNISKIFDDFSRRVLKNAEKITPNDLVGVFISAVIDKENCYQHPNNENKLVCHNKQYDINGKYYKTFFSHFEKEYSPEDKNKFTEISDRLIEDTKRRRSGEFYTPTLFTDYAHKMLSEQLGEDWKEKYVVWDCCWGTGNLTRDYRFKELYASTLEQAELDCGQRYNPEATKFVFDFLNDDISNLFGSKLPPKLYEALEQNKPIVFFINPPYATAGNKGGSIDSKEGCAKTKTNTLMKKNDMGRCSENLYAQFIYRILSIKSHFKLNNVVLALFSPTGYLCGSTFNLFRKELFNHLCFCDGILFNASNFSNVAANWAISFAVWKSGKTKNGDCFDYKIVSTSNEGQELNVKGRKIIYNLDNYLLASKWVRKLTDGVKTYDAPQMTSALNIKTEGKTMCGSMTKDAIGYFFNDSNNVRENPVGVAMFTSPYTKGHGLSVTRENIFNCCALLSARKLIELNWVNQNDQYIEPDEKNVLWNEYKNSALIYALFHFGGGQASNQSSLRNIQYKNQTWDIKNEFFFMSKAEIMKLANENNFDFTYNDAKVSEERFVYKKLQEIELSKEAQDVLNKAVELTRKSFKYREMFNQEHPEYQIMNWDCGWYQIKAVLKEYFADDLKEFQNLYKILADKMRPMVYELGFLK